LTVQAIKNADPEGKTPIRLLSYNNLESAQELSKHFDRPIIATDDIVRVHPDGGITTVARSGNDTQKWYRLEGGKKTEGETHIPTKPSIENEEKFVQMGWFDHLFRKITNDDFVNVLVSEQYRNAMKDLDIKDVRIVTFYEKLQKDVDYKSLLSDFLAHHNRYNLTETEAQAIFGYTVSLYFSTFNDLLRKGELSKTLAMKNLLVGGLSKMDISTGIHYRGIKLKGKSLENFLEKHQLGKEVTYKDFVSAGSVKEGSYYEKPSKNVKIKIQSRTARDISALADGVHFRGRSPKEVVFLPDITFEVTSFKKEGNNYYIEIVEK